MAERRGLPAPRIFPAGVELFFGDDDFRLSAAWIAWVQSVSLRWRAPSCELIVHYGGHDEAEDDRDEESSDDRDGEWL
jgi:hypothetical protein